MFFIFVVFQLYRILRSGESILIFVYKKEYIDIFLLCYVWVDKMFIGFLIFFFLIIYFKYKILEF